MLFRNRVDLVLIALRRLPEGRGVKRCLAGCKGSFRIFKPFFRKRDDINVINSGKIITNNFRSNPSYIINLTSLLSCGATKPHYKWKSQHAFNDSSIKIEHTNFRYAKLLSCLKKKSLWWDFLIMPLRLSSHFNVAEMVVPRNLKHWTVSMSWPLIVNGKTTFVLRLKSNTISFVFRTFNFKLWVQTPIKQCRNLPSIVRFVIICY